MLEETYELHKNTPVSEQLITNGIQKQKNLKQQLLIQMQDEKYILFILSYQIKFL